MVELDTGRLTIPSESKPDRGLVLHVSDEVGNTTAVVLRAAASEVTPTLDEAVGCAATRSDPTVSFVLFAAVWAIVRRRKP